MAGTLKTDGIQTAGLAAEDLGGMIAQESTIARCPEARRMANRKVWGWLSSSRLRKIEVGLPGVIDP
jgi:hypothetical protein